MNSICVEGNLIETDAEGYLLHWQEWNETIANALAQTENLTMDKARWEIVYFLREFYQNYNTVPTTRALVKAVEKAFGKEKGNSIYLHHLFPQGPVKQASKIAGLPKPAHCL